MKNSIIILVLTLFVSFANAQSSSSKISVSVKSTNDQYSYTARFDKINTNAAKAVIVNTLGSPTEETSRTSIWNGKGYSVNLRDGKVEMKMIKDETTKSFHLKFEDMGEQVSESIGSPKTPEPPKIR